MNLYLLTRREFDEARDYDEAAAFVVRARTTARARAVVASQCGDEGPDVWRSPQSVSCSLLGEASGSGASEEAVVLRDYRAA